MEKVMLEITNLKKSIKDKNILKGINFSANKGELIHIIGINGSGKSTLFKIIAYIMEPDSGEIKIDSEIKIGALIENPSFMENSSAKENIKFLANINKNYYEDKIRQLFIKFGLDFDDKHKISKYSLGMRQKVGIIQAIMENQNLILLDEPTRGLDEEALKIFKLVVDELLAENKTIIIASHDNLSNLKFTRKFKLTDGVLKEYEE